jgi:hypothetical protein
LDVVILTASAAAETFGAKTVTSLDLVTTVISLTAATMDICWKSPDTGGMIVSAVFCGHTGVIRNGAGVTACGRTMVAGLVSFLRHSDGVTTVMPTDFDI